MICTDTERDVLNMMYFICVHVFCNEHADNVFSLRIMYSVMNMLDVYRINKIVSTTKILYDQ